MNETEGEICDPNNLDECFPLKSFLNVLKWKEPSSLNWAKFVKPLKERANHCLKGYPICGNSEKVWTLSRKCPRTLVCHDMKGGYINDRLVNGHNNLSDYKFLSWPAVDIFVYFSHQRVTIPPLAWINSGHTHGVLVLGTIITEGEEGASEWNAICNDHSLLDTLAAKLVLLCKYYGFDGYLLNIENKLDPEFVKGPFIRFINTLSYHLKQLSSDKLLIWYDAVTNAGDLKWQNKLNEKNRDFFNACDGIFLNYCWDENALIESVDMAGDRKHDVYVGIDVFGRGCFGGGGFSTNKAFNLIRKHDLSAAIFAPGWVHECCEKNENAEYRNFKFWKIISDYLYTHGPASLPFETSFCYGFGHQTCENGLIVKNDVWFNQSKMSHVPTILTGSCELEDNCCIAYYEKDSFSGGGCLLICQNFYKQDNEDHIDCLLVCDFSTSSENAVCIEVLTKPLVEGEHCEMDLVVSTGTIDEETTFEKFHFFTICNNSAEKINEWYKSSFKLELGPEHILSLGCKLTGKRKPLLLGYLHIYSIAKSFQSSTRRISPRCIQMESAK